MGSSPSPLARGFGERSSGALPDEARREVFQKNSREWEARLLRWLGDSASAVGVAGKIRTIYSLL